MFLKGEFSKTVIPNDIYKMPTVYEGKSEFRVETVQFCLSLVQKGLHRSSKFPQIFASDDTSECVCVFLSSFFSSFCFNLDLQVKR